ncbi:GDSL-type esterase/lipase family protein [Streptomyces sp. ALI-76-A]|uniref:GDSL-type esterase/lipase family protein n=1 Tax=Streptomyces sp. ALI-76-A TaxID=3025736 RepID=UPI00256EC23A|nr:GDSL-type esterase/lipase family protein [Streptomyces sp. ALI-76-A]MDL5206299.1 GDSL-type esterase/lipase family protein [Streptomyces sp. ALI-76-A]
MLSDSEAVDHGDGTFSLVNINSGKCLDVKSASITAGCAGLRIRLSNLRSTTALSVGAATVAVQSSGATAVAGTTRTVTFGRSATPTIAAGQELTSDVIAMPVVAEQNLLVEAATSFTTTTARWFYVAGLDVVSPTANGTVVAIGDSITDGSSATDNANQRWPDYLARRLQAQSGGQRLGVVNAGIGGNRVVTDSPSAQQGIAAMTRFSHDVLTQPGVKNAIVLEGINDINNSSVTADQIIAGYQTMIDQAHTAGVRIIGGTILPHSSQTAAKAAIRAQVNDWIRTSGAFDAVIDFDAALRDPANPARLLPAYDSGDHLHPNSAGMQAIANTVNLSLLTS